MLFLRPVLKMDEASWVEAHVAAFEFFGGVVARVVPDNLKTGVVKPDLYDPKINRAFGEFAGHYGCLIDPARALKPRDKARVERPVPYARDSFFAGRADEFATLADMQIDAVRWSRDVANQRPCRALDRVAPQALFDAEEKQTLLALPRHPFELARWSRATVNPDIHIKVGKALYSVPWRFIGKQVDARKGASSVEVFLDGVLIKTHARIERGKQTDFGRLPAGEDRLLHAHPGVVPAPGRRAGRGGGRGGRSHHGGERPLSPAPGPRGGPPGRQPRPRAPGGGLPPGSQCRGPVLQDGQGHPGGRHRTRRRG